MSNTINKRPSTPPLALDHRVTSALFEANNWGRTAAAESVELQILAKRTSSSSNGDKTAPRAPTPTSSKQPHKESDSSEERSSVVTTPKEPVGTNKGFEGPRHQYLAVGSRLGEPSKASPSTDDEISEEFSVKPQRPGNILSAIGLATLDSAGLAVPAMVRDKLGHFAKIVERSVYNKPPTISGGVVFGADGSVSATHPVLASLVHACATISPTTCKSPAGRASSGTLSLAPPDSILAMHKIFRAGATFDDLNLGMIVLWRALTEGAGGLGKKKAFLNNDAATFLREVGRRVEVTGFPAISALVKAEPDVSTESGEKLADLQLRVGAAMMMSIERQKELDWYTGGFLAASMVGSGLLGWGSSVGIDKLEKSKFGQNFTSDSLSSGQKFAAAMLDSLEAFLPELYDAMVVSRLQEYVGSRDKKDLVPSFSDFAGAAKSGVTAVFGTMPQAILDRFKVEPPALREFLSFAFNEVAVFACGAIVPYELSAQEGKLRAAIVSATEDGLLAPAPAGESGKAFADRLTSNVLAIQPGTELAQKSLGYAAMYGAAGWLTAAAGVPARALSVLQRTLYNPVEALSLNMASFFAKKIGGLDGWITTDQRKNEQLLSLALESAAQGRQPTDADLNGIFQPKGEIMGPLGRGLNKAMSTAGGAVAAVVRAGAELTGLVDRKQPLNYDALTRGNAQA